MTKLEKLKAIHELAQSVFADAVDAADDAKTAAETVKLTWAAYKTELDKQGSAD